MSIIRNVIPLAVLALFAVALFSCNRTAGEADATADGDGKKWLLYVGTYTKPEPHVDGKADGLYQMHIDQKTGQLEMVGVTKDVTNPSFIALSPNQKYLFAVNEVGTDVAPEGWIAAFRIDPQVPRPILLNRDVSRGVAPCHLTVDRTGKWLLVANYGGGVATLRIGDDGQIESTPYDQKLPEKDGKASHPHMVHLSPDNRFLYVPDKGTDRVYIFRFNELDGSFNYTTNITEVQPGAGPRHLTFHPNGRFVYLINELDNTVNAFRQDAATGRLDQLQSIGTLPSDFSGTSYCADIHVSPDGRFLYGSNRGHNSIVIYRIEPEQGTLTLVGHKETRGDFPRNFMITPNGEFLYVANQNTDNITAFRRDADSGELTFIGQYRVPTPVCLKIW